MQDFVVVFTSGSGVPTPRFHPCRAGDADAAEELCQQAHPDCQVVWVAETSDPDAAFREHFSHGRLTPGQWVIWHDPDDDACTQPARFVASRGEVAVLRGHQGSEIECPYSEIGPARPVVDTESLGGELHYLSDQIRELVNSALEDQGDKAESCQRMAVLQALQELEATFNGIAEDDIQHTFGYECGRRVRARITPEAEQDGTIAPVDPPDGQRTEWDIPAWELEGLWDSSDGHRLMDEARHMGDAPAWVRHFHGPFTITAVDGL